MAIHLGWSRYLDANPVPTSPLADDITTAPSGPVCLSISKGILYATFDNKVDQFLSTKFTVIFNEMPI